MALFLITLTAFGLIMAAMAIGIIVSNRQLRGSCGGPAILDDRGEPMTCPDCNCDAAPSIVPVVAEPPAG